MKLKQSSQQFISHPSYFAGFKVLHSRFYCGTRTVDFYLWDIFLKNSDVYLWVFLSYFRYVNEMDDMILDFHKIRKTQYVDLGWKVKVENEVIA